MKALFVYPQFPDTFWSLRHAVQFLGKRACSPPLGLATVAALLPPAWAKRLVDTNIRPLSTRDLAWADYVFVSAMAVQRDSARQIVARCRQAGVKVVAGGPLFTAEHELFPQVDHLVLNEAELTLPRFLADLEQGRPGRVYATDELADIHRTPAPMWELLELRSYSSMSIQFSRGCPYDCEFCDVTALFGRAPRTKTVEQVLAELEGLYQAGWRGSVFFADDNLIGNRPALREQLLPALVRWQRAHRYPFNFNTQASINLADDRQLVQSLVRAGFDAVFVGIETPEPEGLAECGKTPNRRRDLIADVKRLQRAGLQVQAGFIVGFDSDTPSIFQRQVQFIQQSGIVMAMVGLLQAFAGTRLYERLHREGRLRDLEPGDNVGGTTNIMPRMGLETLREGHRQILRQIYSPGPYYQRIRTFLREFSPLPSVAVPLRATHLAAFFRSLVRLGIAGRERVHYWRLLLWTALRRPRLLPWAVALAICGHHYRRVCELAASDA